MTCSIVIQLWSVLKWFSHRWSIEPNMVISHDSHCQTTLLVTSMCIQSSRFYGRSQNKWFILRHWRVNHEGSQEQGSKVQFRVRDVFKDMPCSKLWWLKIFTHPWFRNPIYVISYITVPPAWVSLFWELSTYFYSHSRTLWKPSGVEIDFLVLWYIEWPTVVLILVGTLRFTVHVISSILKLPQLVYLLLASHCH